MIDVYVDEWDWQKNGLDPATSAEADGLSHIKGEMESFVSTATEMNMPILAKVADEYQYVSSLSVADAKAKLEHFKDVLRHESESAMFLSLAPGVQELIWDDAPLGDEAFGVLPIAEDAKEAAFCYGVGRYTACVFHLMRVVELTLRAVASKHRVNFRGRLDYQEWGSIIRKVREKINKKIAAARKKYTKGPGPAKEAEIQRYIALIDSVDYFSQTDRNPLFHTRISYKPHEAFGILLRVKDFVTQVARLLSEKHKDHSH